MNHFSEYRNIYDNFKSEIPCDFQTFSIKFKCHLLQNNILLVYINNRGIHRFIKTINDYDLQNCKDILHLTDDQDYNYDIIYTDNVPKTPKKKVNVVISAYQAQDFIEECLDSINKQTYGYKRILLGIDGCNETLQKVLKIRNNYRNLHVYYSEENSGPYTMFNALIDLVPDNEYIQIFGADDIMNPNMLEVMSSYEKPVVSKHCGVLFILKNHFKILGGFRAWRCAADGDMLSRIRLARIFVSFAPQLFFRRIHANQLTEATATNFNSEIRKNYNRIAVDNYNSDSPVIFVQPICSKITKV